MQMAGVWSVLSLSTTQISELSNWAAAIHAAILFSSFFAIITTDISALGMMQVYNTSLQL
jgi:hypothetical protein